MKNLRVFISLIFIILIFTLQSYAKIDPKTVVSMWLFDDKSNLAKDSSPNKVDGKILGAPQLGEGKFDQALKLNGSNDYISCEDEAHLNLTDAITVVGWMTTTNIARWNVIAAKEIWDSKAGWILYVPDSTGSSFACGEIA